MIKDESALSFGAKKALEETQPQEMVKSLLESVVVL